MTRSTQACSWATAKGGPAAAKPRETWLLGSDTCSGGSARPACPPGRCKQRSRRSGTKRRAAPCWWHEWSEEMQPGDRCGPAEQPKFLENACDYISFIPWTNLDWTLTELCDFFFLSPSEKAMAPRSSALAWKSPWTEEPGGLQPMGSLRVGHDWATSLSLVTFMHWRRKWQPTAVFLPGESQGRGRTESDTTEVT